MKNSRVTIFVSILVIIGVVSSCFKDEYSLEIEKQERDEYIAENNIYTEPTASGLYYIEILEGTGEMPVPGEVVEVEYTGTFLNGEEFDSGKFSFTIGIMQVIKGWDEGIAYMKVGGKAKLIIPSNLGYGIQGSNSGLIPPYTTLLFEVELIDIK